MPSLPPPRCCPPSVPRSSVATDAFADAIGIVASHRIEPDDRRLPLAFVGPRRRPRRSWERLERDAGLPALVGPLAAAVAAQRAGEASSVELVESALAAVEAHDRTLQAIVELDVERARSQAQAADADRRAGRWRGPLHGIPVSVKDVIDVASLPTRAGSLAYERHPDADAAGVARLRAAGAVVIGKVSTHEFALGVTTPQSRNPFDPARIPGGSSGGSAISVATGMALASLGTDTRASIRVPAALTGVVGMKATHGAIPVEGVVSLSWTMDHVAPMAASVGDAAIVLGALLGDVGGVDLASVRAAPGLRVGVPLATLEHVDPAVADAFQRVLRALAEHADAVVVDVDRPSASDLDLAGAAGMIVSRCEAAALHRSLGLDRFLYWDEVADQLDAADRVLASDYLDAQRARGQLGDGLVACFDHVDVLAMPTAPVVAPLVDEYECHLMTLARNAIPWSLVGFPAVSVPMGTAGGLPVGLQLVAPPHAEGLLIAAAQAAEGVQMHG